MFAGLPGIGVGTLFYVLTALWMPVWELVLVAQGRSSWARWRLIGRQLFFAGAIIASIATADRLLTWALGWKSSTAVGPARWIHDELGVRTPNSIWAAPIMASVLLLLMVLGVVQAARWLLILRRRRSAGHPAVVSPPRSVNTSPVT